MILSTFYSGAEAALFSLSPLKLKGLPKSSTTELIKKFLSTPQKLLITLLIGITFANVIASALATHMFISLFRKFQISELWATTTSIGVMTIVILTFCEILPITMGATYPEVISKIVIRPVKFFFILFTPIRIILSWIINIILRSVQGKELPKESPITEKELKTIVDVGEQEGIIKIREKELIHSIFEFGDVLVGEVMHAISKIVWISSEEPIQKIIQIFKETKYSRILICEGKIDKPIGMLHIKDMLPCLRVSQKKRTIMDILRPIYYVYMDQKVNEILQDFQHHKIQIALVKDRAEKNVGFLTMEDLLEEIVGEIHSE